MVFLFQMRAGALILLFARFAFANEHACTTHSDVAVAAGLLQRDRDIQKSLEAKEGAQDFPAELLAAWVASPFGDCNKCPLHDMQFRSVTCTRVVDGASLPESACGRVPRPPLKKQCDCAEMPCNVSNSHSQCESPLDDADTENGIDFVELGCFARVQGDAGATPPAPSPYALACKNYSAASLCRSGLPFYRFLSNDLSPDACYQFCVGKGLDIFALVDNTECRCGASAVNVNAGHRSTPKVNLLFDPGLLSPWRDDRVACPLRVYRYAGVLTGGGLPYSLMSLNAADAEYVDSIVFGHAVQT